MPMLFFNEIATDSIKAASVITLENGFGTMVKLTMGDTKDPIRFQAPIMRLAWDANISDKFGPPACVLPLCLDPEDGFSAWLTELRGFLKGLCVANSLAWYGKALTEAQVDEYLGELRRPAKDSRYSDLFTPKVPLREDKEAKTCEMNIKAFTADKVRYHGNPADLLTKNAKVVAEISIPYIFFGKGNKSITIRCEVVNTMVIPTEQQDEFQFNLNAQPILQQIAAAVDKRKAEYMTELCPSAAADGEGAVHTDGEGSVDGGACAAAVAPEPLPKKARLEYDADSDDDV